MILAFSVLSKLTDQKKLTRSLVLRGDLLLHDLCYKPSRVTSANGEKINSSGSQRSSGITMSGDKALFMLLISDLCDAFDGQWHTLDIVKLPELLMQSHTLTCIFLPSFPSEYRSVIDGHLQQFSYYLGAVVPDLSNPLQKQLLVDSLCRDAFIEKGVVHMELSFGGDLDGDFGGANKFSKQGIVGLPIEEFAKRSPSMPIPRARSKRAMVTFMRLQNRLKLNIHERLASQLSSLDADRNPSTEYDWDLEQLPNAPDEVEVKAD